MQLCLLQTGTAGAASEDPVLPDAPTMHAYVQGEKLGEIAYFWHDLNAKERKKMVEWMLASKGNRTGVWSEYYRKELKQVIEKKGTAEYAFELMEALHGAHSPFSGAERLALNWVAARELPDTGLRELTAMHGTRLKLEDQPGLQAFSEMSRHFEHALDLTLISTFQQLKQFPKSVSFDQVATLMRFGLDPLTATYLPVTVRLECLNQVWMVQAKHNLDLSSDFPQYSVSESGQLEKTMLHPRAMQEYAVKEEVLKGLIKEAEPALHESRDAEGLLRLALFSEARGHAFPKSAAELNVTEIRTWALHSPEAIHAFLGEVAFVNSVQKLSPKFLQVNNAVIYEYLFLDRAKSFSNLKTLVLDQHLPLSESAEKMFFSKLALSQMLNKLHQSLKMHGALTPGEVKLLQSTKARFESSLGETVFAEEMKTNLAEFKPEHAQLMSEIAATPASAIPEKCGFFTRLKNLF